MGALSRFRPVDEDGREIGGGGLIHQWQVAQFMCVCVCINCRVLELIKRAMWCLFAGVVYCHVGVRGFHFQRWGGRSCPWQAFCAWRCGGHCKFVLCKCLVCLLCVRVRALGGV